MSSQVNYKIESLQNDTYQIMEEIWINCPIDGNVGISQNIVFQSSLSDCEAWIRLHKEGYL